MSCPDVCQEQHALQHAQTQEHDGFDHEVSHVLNDILELPLLSNGQCNKPLTTKVLIHILCNVIP